MIIGIGAGQNIGKVIRSISSLPEGVSARIYTYPHSGIEDAPVDVVRTAHPEELLVRDLVTGAIDAAVRGSLPASSTLSSLKNSLGVGRLDRIALLETVEGKKFLLAPVGVDEGWTAVEKLVLIEKSRTIARKFGMNDAVAVLSGGRLGDIGRHARVDRSLGDAELIARISGADHTEILIEDAIEDHGIIIAPDGISGNLIFRTLVFLGGGSGHGAPVVNIDKIFVDTSRASPDYSNAILLAASLLK